MNARMVAVGLIAPLAVAACRSAGDEASRASSRFAGVDVRLQEVEGERAFDLVPTGPARAWRQRIDQDSTLFLSFDRSVEAALEAQGSLGEWEHVNAALAALSDLARRYLALNREAAALPAEFGPETAAFRDRVEAFDRDQKRFEEGAIGLLGAERLEELIFDDERNPYEALAAAIDQARNELHRMAQAEIEGQDSLRVVVRAKLTPKGGVPQFLQVPGYYEIADQDLLDARAQALSTPARLRAQIAAAQEAKDVVQGLLDDRGQIQGALKRNVEAIRDRLRETLDQVVRDLGDWAERLETLLSDPESVLASALAPEEQLARDLVVLKRDIETARQLVDELTALVRTAEERGVEGLVDSFVAGDLLDTYASFAARATGLIRDIRGEEEARDGWAVLLPRIRDEAGELLRQGVASDVEGRLTGLVASVADEQRAKVEGVLGRVRAIEAQVSAVAWGGNGGDILAGLAELDPDPGTPIPRLPKDLVDAEIDLQGSGVAKGDKVDVSVEFWDEENLGADGRPKDGVSPEFSALYKTNAIQSGWIWSGDVVFTRPFQGRNDFTANAAVSFERHWYLRDDVDALVNRLDPGLGFHAAQLNQDPDTTTEIGVGLNVSMWDGLLRTGVGYNISVDGNEEYWFFGFGVISALDSLKSLTPGEAD